MVAEREKQCIDDALTHSRDEMAHLTATSDASVELLTQRAKNERDRELSECRAKADSENAEISTRERDEYALQAKQERDSASLMGILTEHAATPKSMRKSAMYFFANHSFDQNQPLCDDAGCPRECADPDWLPSTASRYWRARRIRDARFLRLLTRHPIGRSVRPEGFLGLAEGETGTVRFYLHYLSRTVSSAHRTNEKGRRSTGAQAWNGGPYRVDNRRPRARSPRSSSSHMRLHRMLRLTAGCS